MNRWLACVSVVVAVGCTPTYLEPAGTGGNALRAGNDWIGIDANAPIGDGSGDIAPQLDGALLAELGVGSVRINFLLGPWSSPEDTTPHGAAGLDWEGTYRAIVDDLTSHGIEVYGLIGGQSVYSDHPVGSDAWLGDYLYNAVAIVDRFKGDVRIWESFNEPNNWVADWTPTLTPEQYALLLQEFYLQIKHYNGHADDPAWQVTVVSGPMLSHDQDTAATYLSDTMAYGHGSLAWDWTHENTGSIPLDGVGYHLYVVQDQTGRGTIRRAIDGQLDAIESAFLGIEGYLPPVYVSEVGWPSDAVGEQGQATALYHGLRKLEGDPRVALATVFSVVDFQGSTYGIRYDAATPKPAWDTVRALAH